MQLALIKSPVEQELELVNQLIQENTQSEATLINQVISNLTLKKGKQLRPLLLLLVANACHHTNVTQRALYAVIIEFVHTATLLHDDVIDDSTKRRGEQTANARFGNKLAILSGDYLYTRAMLLLTKLERLDVMHLFTNTVEQIIEGEVKQLMLSKTLLSEKDYFEIIKNKTSLLFSLAAEIGAVLTNSSNKLQNDLSTFALHLGNAFQITDDLLDFTADPALLGKNLCDDLSEGKATLPIIHACEHASKEESSYLEACLTQNIGFDFSKILSILEANHSINYAKEQAKKEAEKAKKHLSALDPTPYKEALTNLCDFAVLRTT